MPPGHLASGQQSDLVPQPALPASEEEVLTYLFHRRNLPRDRLAAVVAAVHDPGSSAHSLAGLLCEPLDDPAPPRSWLERIQAVLPSARQRSLL